MKRIKIKRSKLSANRSLEGETIETKMDRVVNNKEPIEDVSPIIYQPRSEGVRPEFDIRTDRFNLAIEAMDVVSGSKIAQRRSLVVETPKSSENESAQGTNNQETN
ncbi:hypothetical protein D0T84_05350 [Dysgonomonas sp. 521]|uniref:hypothetical protein n=1 Tax=Dysgonomonas sp. 521 TaxID=2302932 RepID=UPI0013D1F2E4|nr:hypothetical protein [Dysgonomonas sp. 521]NDV94344.1 hypothetical protein [Dysgonomonas sp. 521]